MLYRRSPTGGKACDRPSVSQFLPYLVEHFSIQPFSLVVGQYRELLIGGRLDKKRYLFIQEQLAQLHRHFDCMLADTEIEVVGKQCVKLDSQEPPFSQQGSMLFDDGE